MAKKADTSKAVKQANKQNKKTAKGGSSNLKNPKKKKSSSSNSKKSNSKKSSSNSGKKNSSKKSSSSSSSKSNSSSKSKSVSKSKANNGVKQANKQNEKTSKGGASNLKNPKKAKQSSSSNKKSSSKKSNSGSSNKPSSNDKAKGNDYSKFSFNAGAKKSQSTSKPKANSSQKKSTTKNKTPSKNTQNTKDKKLGASPAPNYAYKKVDNKKINNGPSKNKSNGKKAEHKVVKPSKPNDYSKLSKAMGVKDGEFQKIYGSQSKKTPVKGNSAQKRTTSANKTKNSRISSAQQNTVDKFNAAMASGSKPLSKKTRDSLINATRSTKPTTGNLGSKGTVYKVSNAQQNSANAFKKANNRITVANPQLAMNSANGVLGLLDGYADFAEDKEDDAKDAIKTLMKKTTAKERALIDARLSPLQRYQYYNELDKSERQDIKRELKKTQPVFLEQQKKTQAAQAKKPVMPIPEGTDPGQFVSNFNNTIAKAKVLEAQEKVYGDYIKEMTPAQQQAFKNAPPQNRGPLIDTMKKTTPKEFGENARFIEEMKGKQIVFDASGTAGYIDNGQVRLAPSTKITAPTKLTSDREGKVAVGTIDANNKFTAAKPVPGQAVIPGIKTTVPAKPPLLLTDPGGGKIPYNPFGKLGIPKGKDARAYTSYDYNPYTGRVTVYNVKPGVNQEITLKPGEILDFDAQRQQYRAVKKPVSAPAKVGAPTHRAPLSDPTGGRFPYNPFGQLGIPKGANPKKHMYYDFNPYTGDMTIHNITPGVNQKLNLKPDEQLAFIMYSNGEAKSYVTDKSQMKLFAGKKLTPYKPIYMDANKTKLIGYANDKGQFVPLNNTFTDINKNAGPVKPNALSQLSPESLNVFRIAIAEELVQNGVLDGTELTKADQFIADLDRSFTKKNILVPPEIIEQGALYLHEINPRWAYENGKRIGFQTDSLGYIGQAPKGDVLYTDPRSKEVLGIFDKTATDPINQYRTVKDYYADPNNLQQFIDNAKQKGMVGYVEDAEIFDRVMDFAPLPGLISIGKKIAEIGIDVVAQKLAQGSIINAIKTNAIKAAKDDLPYSGSSAFVTGAGIDTGLRLSTGEHVDVKTILQGGLSSLLYAGLSKGGSTTFKGIVKDLGHEYKGRKNHVYEVSTQMGIGEAAGYGLYGPPPDDLSRFARQAGGAFIGEQRLHKTGQYLTDLVVMKGGQKAAEKTLLTRLAGKNKISEEEQLKKIKEQLHKLERKAEPAIGMAQAVLPFKVITTEAREIDQAVKARSDASKNIGANNKVKNTGLLEQIKTAQNPNSKVSSNKITNPKSINYNDYKGLLSNTVPVISNTPSGGSTPILVVPRK